MFPNQKQLCGLLLWLFLLQTPRKDISLSSQTWTEDQFRPDKIWEGEFSMGLAVTWDNCNCNRLLIITERTNQEILVGNGIKKRRFDPAFSDQPATQIYCSNSKVRMYWSTMRKRKHNGSEHKKIEEPYL